MTSSTTASSSAAAADASLPPPLTGPALEEHARKAWAFYESIGSPKFVGAPMVDQSELPFRLLCRRYGTQLCYTPMVHAACFLKEKRPNRAEIYYCNTTPEDWPLIAQMCGNDPATLLGAAKELARIPGVCAVDLNLGCPQGIAKKGHYGAFLLEETELLVRIVSTLSRNLDIPVTCKIRLLPSLEDTMALVHALVGAGCSLLTVHGRTKEMNKHRVGECDWEAIRAIREAVPIPVFANGGVADRDDVDRCLEATGVAGVMSSEALLENPGLFSRNVDSVTGQEASQDDLAVQYLELVERHPPLRLKVVRAHVFKMIFTGLKRHHDLRDRLAAADYQGILDVVAEMRARRSQDADPAVHGRSWYWRYWPGNAEGAFRLEGQEEDDEDGEGCYVRKGEIKQMPVYDTNCLFGCDDDEE